MKTLTQVSSQLSGQNSKPNSLRLTVVRNLAIALLSLASLQAVAGQGGPSAEERAKMDAAFQTACGGDISTFCPTAENHHERHACLRANEANLSPTCSAFVAEMKAHRPPGPPPEQTTSSSSSATN